MKICRDCNAQIEDNVSVCPYCGAKQTAENSTVLMTMMKFLQLEHFAWKFGAIMAIVAVVIYIIAGITMMATGGFIAQRGGSTESGMIVFAGVLYIIIGIMVFIPIVIIGFMMLKKVEYYESVVYTDVSIARARLTSVGMIVFCAIFNTLAMIFYLINFIKTKNSAAELDRIEAEQKGL